jgi:hypothetical protein
MKNTFSIRVMALFGLATALIPVAAMAQSSPTRFTVPFSFTVGQKSFAAGDYSVGEIYHGVLAIESRDGNGNVTITTSPDEPGKVQGVATLTFHRYGDRYFLCGLSDTSHGWAVPKSKAEKELIAARASPKPLEIMARK